MGFFLTIRQMKTEEEIITVESNVSVNLIVTGQCGSVVACESVGGIELANVLKLAAERDDYPIQKSDSLIDCIGQDIYACSDYEYIKSISGAFSHLTFDRSRELTNIVNKESMNFSFIISY